MEYGEKIVALRKSKGMTQAELGNELNVTYQAVSKWERGESYPDFETLCKISKIFGVPVTYFADGIIPDTAETVAAAPEPEPAPVMAGVCKICGKVVYEGDEGERYPALICHDCVEKRNKEQTRAAEQARLRAEGKREANKRQAKKMRNKGLIAAGIIIGILLIFTVIGLILNPVNIGETILGFFIVTLFLFTFISQLFWHGFIVSVCLAGVKIIGTPGIIFTFDLDGFIFLIAMKLLFAVLKIVVLLICMAVCIIAAIIFSPFSFIPALVSLSKGNLPD